MVLNTTIAVTPGRSAWCCFANKTILYFQAIVLEFFVVVQSAKCIIKTFVLIITNAEYSILYPKGVTKVFTKWIACYFHRPSIEILTIEKLDPLLFFGRKGSDQ